MAKTIVGLFDTFAEAQTVVQDLVNNGFSRDAISLVANDARGEYANYNANAVGDSAGAGAATGAVTGAVGGGVIGLLVGIGALAIPGIGPVLAAGPLVSALGAAGAATVAGAGIGAVAGGLVGALIGAGVPEEHAHVYTEGVRRGGTLVTVNADDTMANSAYSIMQRHGAVDVDSRGTSYRESGWSRFDPEAGPYNANDWERSSKVGTAAGTAAGAATGAAIGSVAGPVGTVVGGIAGAATGAGVGAAGDVAGRKADDQDGDAGELDDPRKRTRR